MDELAGADLLEVVGRDECVRRLRRGGVGRIGVVAGGAPLIRPVNFAFADGRVLIRTGDTAVSEAAARGDAAEFEVDEIRTSDHTGWSVIVTGHLTELSPVDDAAPVEPWAPGDKPRLVALAAETISGRRLGPAPAAVSPPPLDEQGHDAWGRSESTRRRMRRVVGPMYRWWFRVSWEGLERIPRRGGALLVANHAGAIPVDAALLMHGIEAELGRAVYGLHHHGLRELPYVGTLLAENGGVVAHPDNAFRLLHDEQQLVLVFPEGTKGTGKLYRDRYRLARFGRGGFIETAMRAGVPVVPIAITGTEETMPTLLHVPITRGLQLPITLNMILLGPLGAAVHFPSQVHASVLEPITFDQPPSLEQYPVSEVAAATEHVRSRLQAALRSRIARDHRVQLR